METFLAEFVESLDFIQAFLYDFLQFLIKIMSMTILIIVHGTFLAEFLESLDFMEVFL